MNNSEFALAFEYYFKHFYAQQFPRDPMIQNLMRSIDSLYARARQLKSTKSRNSKMEFSDISLWEACQSLVSTNNNHTITPAKRQLYRILDNCLIQNLFLTYDEISNYADEMLLPPNDVEQEKPNGLPIKIVNIVKGSEPLGATIKAYPNGEIYVARVIVGGAADRCGSIQPGDQILEVNDVPVSFKSPNEIIDIVQTGNGVVSFKLVPKKGSMIESASTSQHKHQKMKKYVRAHFDYMGNEDQLQPCRQAALSFQNGDVLEILANDDPYWLQARCVGHGTLVTAVLDQDDEITITDMSSLYDHAESSKHLSVGIIPTELVLFQQKASSSTYSSLPDVFYEPVSMLYPGENRPVILIGAPGVGRNEIKKRLIAHNPIKFAAPVPHTSRPKRPTERQGVDYVFVSREEIENGISGGHFIEYGEFNGNLYGTMNTSILNLLSQGKTPVINAHCLSLRKLRSAAFRPLVVFVEPPNFSLLRKTRMNFGARTSFPPSGRHFTDQDFANIISYSAQLSISYGKYADFRIVNGVLSEAMDELVRIIHDYEILPSWVPEQWVNNDQEAFKNSVC